MRWARYLVDGKETFGIINGEDVIDVLGNPFDGFQQTENRRLLSSTKLLAPVMPRTFYAAGLNYAEHVREAAKKLGRSPDLPQAADIGYRAINSITGPDDPIIVPADATELLQYEGELVVVIGKEARNLNEDNVLDCILGYTIGNDVSERTWQKGDRTMWRGKNTDTFAPMGPWIETEFNLSEAMTSVRVNGQEKITFKTDSWIFGIKEFLIRMSEYCTLYPRDVVWMGTEGKTDNMVHGDVCEIEITGLGVLRNTVQWRGK
ncbi:MAG: fumarylacetoacetate hydrolase family protein [Alphaproteobacteria bacterium]|jgi:2-keto-4-pentenoate hydratase/2-oxohepta-3-ene-1,7-dioic acid hydratase in catechol pathway